MQRRATTFVALVGLSASLALAVPAGASEEPPDLTDHLDVYTGVVDADAVGRIVELGVDRQELELSAVRGQKGKLRVDAILSDAQADALAEDGVELAPKTIDGDTVAARASALAAADGVFRKYSGPGGLKEEMEAQAAAHPDITKLVTIGKTVQGQDIVAVKVGRNADTSVDGRKPTALYIAAQHAREWITPEMIRRLLDHVLEGYETDADIRRLVNRTDMWFVPVSNPDGYDYSFEEDQRLQRKNLRDNDGNGVIDASDGVDLNRNWDYKWGYDNEGSSPNWASETYRGPSPNSEPETQAMDWLFARLTPEFLVNYHSAAELLLHGIGWQVATYSPDDVIYQAMVGDDEDPAVEGYDPDLSAELYTTNGDTDSYAQARYGTLGFTPEMATCESASDSVPDDEWEAEDCGSGFEFPDDESLIQTEFEKNIPFALAVAESAQDPDDPVSVVGRDAEDFRVDTFDVSYGDPQTVAVYAKSALNNVLMRYRINGGPVRQSTVVEWQGGERYGEENRDYYSELRGRVEGTKAGDRVEVWFRGRDLDAPRGQRNVQSERFTYTVEQDTGHDTLIIANEDYTGVNPTYPASVTSPKYLNTYLTALRAVGVEPDVWDVDRDGVPHDLGVLSHYDRILWYLGDNRLTQDPEDELIQVGNQQIPDVAVAERQQYLTLAVRDFLNEGGKVIYTGETAAYYGLLGTAVGGIWYAINGDEQGECVVTTSLRDDCLLLADDFTQYYMGAYARTPVEQTDGAVGLPGLPFPNLQAPFGGPAVANNPVDEPGALTVLSDELPHEEFPWFPVTRPAMDYTNPSGPFLPVEGRWTATAQHEDASYMRLARNYDLSAVTAAQTPRFQAQFSWDIEEDYDSILVEAHTVGQNNWTTLAEVGGATTTDVTAECEAGFLLDMHPWLTRYITPGNPCQPQGTSGRWNAILSPSSDGWQQVSYDLSAFAGQQVEVVVSYVTDPATGGVGLVVDDTRLSTTGGVRDAEGFENGLGAWRLLGPPTGSPTGGGDFERSVGLGGIYASVVTDDTVLFGFGLEQVATNYQRVALVGSALRHLRQTP